MICEKGGIVFDIGLPSEDGREFWYARDLQGVLDYAKWSTFANVINRAKEACENSGVNVLEHFADVGKMVELGSGALREIDDFMLSRYACYLIVQNGDPRKEIIAQGQSYFAVKTRERELQEEFETLTEDEKHLTIRNELKNHNKSLVANLFRATQADEKLRREKIKGKERANEAHYEVGKKVRQTIKELGGTMPEDLEKPKKSVKTIEREQQKKLKK